MALNIASHGMPSKPVEALKDIFTAIWAVPYVVTRKQLTAWELLYTATRSGCSHSRLDSAATVYLSSFEVGMVPEA